MFRLINTSHPDIKLIKPEKFKDSRGHFYESFNYKDLKINLNLDVDFIQENVSMSKFNVLRGMHYQIKYEQIKLVRVLKGEIFDVVVDLRRKSKYFGKWFGFNLSYRNMLQIYIPKGFAHGFYVKSKEAIISYKVSNYWYPKYEKSILWNDKTLGINWQITGDPILSIKDKNANLFKNSKFFE